jgi:hypothetical protein
MPPVALRISAAILLLGAGVEGTRTHHDAATRSQLEGHRTVSLGDLLNTVDATTLDFGTASSADVLFDPVRLEPGDWMSLTLVAADGDTVGRFDLTQTSPTTTDVRFTPSRSSRFSRDGLHVETRYLGSVTKSLYLEPADLYDLGVVTSVDGPWLKTWHYVCDGSSCTLVLDPEDTIIDFRADGDGPVRFQTIHVRLSHLQERTPVKLKVRRSFYVN